jgi:hypothetical protein
MVRYSVRFLKKLCDDSGHQHICVQGIVQVQILTIIISLDVLRRTLRLHPECPPSRAPRVRNITISV